MSGLLPKRAPSFLKKVGNECSFPSAVLVTVKITSTNKNFSDLLQTDDKKILMLQNLRNGNLNLLIKIDTQDKKKKTVIKTFSVETFFAWL